MTETTNILLVEDNETHAHLVKRHLRKADFSNITEATSLADALKLMEQNEFSVVLLDLSLPDSPISETLKSVFLERKSEIPVVVLTSLDDLDFATNAVQQGAQDYLVKSDINADILLRSIRYAIERKRAQRQLTVYAKRLEESNKHLRSFAHTLAHEVRSPLTVVSGCLQIVESSHGEDLDDGTLQLLCDSMTAIKGMSDLVESLLEFAQADSTASETQRDVNLESVFYHVAAVLRPMLKDTDGDLTHDDLPTVKGNEVQLRQLFQNLITNAIKYRGEDTPRIHIACETNENEWIISVADNGRGIEPEDQEQIFQPFTRLNHSSQISGVGIGLAFCKRIVENHRGRIWVESEPGKGSTFRFGLPRSSCPLGNKEQRTES